MYAVYKKQLQFAITAFNMRRDKASNLCAIRIRFAADYHDKKGEM
jgi:hypothetical protein